MPTKLCGVLNEAALVAQFRPSEAGLLRGPPPPSLCPGALRSPSQVTFPTAWDFAFLGGSRGKELSGFPGAHDADRPLSSA